MRRWIAAGAAAVVMVSSAVAVAPASAAGNQQWSPGQRLSSTTTNSISSDTDMSTHGSTAVAVWQATDSSGHNRILSSTAVIAGGLATWSEPKVISGSSTKAANPNVAVSADGSRAIAVWGLHASNATMSATATIIGGVASWGAATTVDSGAGAYSTGYFDVDISNNGTTAIVPIAKADSGSAPIGIYAVVATFSGTTVSWGTPALAGTSADTFDGDGGTGASMSLDGDGSSALAVFTTTGDDLLTSASATISGTTPTFGSATAPSPQTTNFQNVNYVYSDLSDDGATALAGGYWDQGFVGSGMLLNTASVSGTSQTWGTTVDTENAKNVDISLSGDGSTALALYDQTVIVDSNPVDQPSAQTATISAGAVSGGWNTTTLQAPLTLAQTALPSTGMLSADGTTALAVVGYSDGDADDQPFSFATTAAVTGGNATWEPLTPLLPLPPVPASDINGFAATAAALSSDGSDAVVIGSVAPVDLSSSTKIYVQAFTLGTAPTVGTVTPGTGSSHGGTAVTVTGTGFGAGATVTVGGVPATDVVVGSDTSITAITGAHAAGTVDVTVTNVNGQSATSTGSFTYVAEPAPTITGVSPSSGFTLGGTPITITGSGFATASGTPTVTIGGVPATAVDVVNPTRITALTPTHAAGVQDVVVTNPDGQAVTGTGLFTYVPAPQPVVTGISPASGPVTGGTEVTIAGSGFFQGAQVTFGGTPAADVVVVNSQLITAFAPAGPAGASQVVVTNVDGLSGAAPTAFVYDSDAPPAPVVQTAGGCAKLPKKLKRHGTTVLLKKHCRTNAGTQVKAKITANKPKHKHYRVDRLTNGKVRIHTLGKKMHVTVELHAPAVPGFSAYKQVKKYKVR